MAHNDLNISHFQTCGMHIKREYFHISEISAKGEGEKNIEITMIRVILFVYECKFNHKKSKV